MQRTSTFSLPVGVFCLGDDTRVAERAAQLMLDGLGSYLVFSGGVGKLTQGMFDKSEAEIFAGIAKKMGVPSEKIIIEDKSTNTGENVRFTYFLLKERSIEADTILLVQKPYMERRTHATFKKQWPSQGVQIHVTSPQISYERYMNSGTISKRPHSKRNGRRYAAYSRIPKAGFSNTTRDS